MSSGYIYVLANSSMPDMVKVGLTTRKPSERAQELSRVTGIPTPFIVVFEKYVDDCQAAENFVHTLLTNNGFRISENREFFSAPIPEVISAIISIPPILLPNKCKDTSNQIDDDLLCRSGEIDELSDLTVNDTHLPPWWDMWIQAESYYYGFGDYIQDYSEALRLYRDTAKLGCNLSFFRIGVIYEYGDGVPININKSLEFYKQGVRNRNYGCYLGMARIFIDNDNNQNAQKCISMFFRDRKENFSKIIESELCITNELRYIMSDGLHLFKKLNEDHIGQIIDIQDCLLKEIDCDINRAQNNASRSPESLDLFVARRLAAKRWIESLA